MALVRRLVELGRAARAEAKVKTRQPLRRALVVAPRRATLLGRAARPRSPRSSTSARVEPLAAAGGDLVDITVKGNFRALGKRFGKRTPAVAAAIARRRRRRAGRRTARAGRGDGRRSTARPSSSPPDEVIVTERPREGWAVANEQGETVALDLELTPELRRGRPGPRGRPGGPGGPQGRRLRGHRPDRAALAGRPASVAEAAGRARASWSPTRCSPPPSRASRAEPGTSARTPTSGCGSRSPASEGRASVPTSATCPRRYRTTPGRPWAYVGRRSVPRDRPERRRSAPPGC